ncbi:MAG: cytidine/deoxycytidylate deaminase family protein [Coriobacteriia bacterium]
MTSERAKRPSWDEYFMAIAGQVAGRSTCLRRHTGAVLVKERRILATGYNGTPRGLAHCDEVGCLREQRGIASGSNHELCRGIHAEQNAVIQAAKHGIIIDGATCYTTHQPCVLCAKILINAGVVGIVFGEPYPDQLSEQLLEEAGIPVTRLPLEGPE